MIDRIIRFSIANRLMVVLLSLLFMVVGLRALFLLPIDAVPDVTNRQVQINAKATAMGPEEIERQVTFPLEVALAGLPRLVEQRSISQYGLSQITVVFEDDVDIYWARQLVHERIAEARESLPPGVSVEMSPISTGLGEIYYLRIDNPDLTLMEKRTLMDWVVRPQLRSIAGLAEVNIYGGVVRQIQVQVDPDRLRAHNLTFRDLVDVLSHSNVNAGGGYINKGAEQQNLRTVATLKTAEDIGNTVIRANVTVNQVAQVKPGPMPRQGAMTRDGEGEEAFAIAMLLMGENGRVVIDRIKDRVHQIETSLPAGSKIVGFLDRSQLIQRTLKTALTNLLEGGLLVVVLLFLFLGQVRAGLIVSSAIPLSMMFAVIGMHHFEISANLMSLGAIDFGLIVDGSVIIVENCVRRLASPTPLSEEERLERIAQATVEVRKATQFGEMIILASYLPILSLESLEGKMFRPMGLTVILALTGALILSFTLTPALCAMFLGSGPSRPSRLPLNLYRKTLEWCLGRRSWILLSALAFVSTCGLLSTRLGGEFIPELDEGALAIQATYLPGSSLDTVIERSTALERHLKEHFPKEIDNIASRIGRPEIATDPMQVFQVDILMTLKPMARGRKARLEQEMRHLLEDLPGVSLTYSQPIKMRMMELIEGVGIRADLGLKLFGEDPLVLNQKAQEIAQVVRQIRGAVDVSVEATSGLPQLDLVLDRARAAQLGVRAEDVNLLIEAGLGGRVLTQINDGSKRIDVTLALPEETRLRPERISQLQVPSQDGAMVPLESVVDFREDSGPAQISRENGQRRVVIQANVAGRDLAGFVDEVRQTLESKVELAGGTYLRYAGTYEKMQSGRARLAVIVPLTFGLILGLLWISFGNVPEALMVFLGVPLAMSGGVLALLLRSMPLSISASIGFIALAGIAVLNGVVMLHFIRDLYHDGKGAYESALEGAVERLRPVLMTAAVAGFGFLPMALAQGAGAEVQKPLATVVIGGILTSSLLTLLVLPVLWYGWRRNAKRPA